MVVEYARNQLGHADANSREFNEKTSYAAIIEMPEHNPGNLGGTMRLGLRKTVFEKDTDSIAQKLYAHHNNTAVKNMTEFHERHRHRYEVNPKLIEEITAKKDFIFTAKDTTGERMEVAELVDHPFYGREK